MKKNYQIPYMEVRTIRLITAINSVSNNILNVGSGDAEESYEIHSKKIVIDDIFDDEE